MNDPNGLVFYQGEYHLFYQYNPFGDKWGHMSWGHAISSNLVHWQYLPVALPEEKGVMIFSGSAVVDWRNSSAFGTQSRPPLVAIYTGHSGTNQSQHIAFSNDRGRTWTKFAGNPVLDIGARDFRDPKVFWHAPTARWIMVVALPIERRIAIYGSTNLKQWEHLSEFGPAGAREGIWECPDLFELPVLGSSQRRWVLVVNISVSVTGGSGCQYFIGDFDGRAFTNGNPDSRQLWADYGKDFYAAVSWSDLSPKDERRVWIGWMSNWQYADRVPTGPWRSAQSLPRELVLKHTSEGLLLAQSPVRELQHLRTAHFTLQNRELSDTKELLSGPMTEHELLEIKATFRPGSADEVGLRIKEDSQQRTIIAYNRAEKSVFVDRSKSGDSSFSRHFSGRHSAPVELEEGTLRLHIYVDRASIEVFAGAGEKVVTELLFPTNRSDHLAFFARGGTALLEKLDVWKLKSIW